MCLSSSFFFCCNDIWLCYTPIYFVLNCLISEKKITLLGPKICLRFNVMFFITNFLRRCQAFDKLTLYLAIRLCPSHEIGLHKIAQMFFFLKFFFGWKFIFLFYFWANINHNALIHRFFISWKFVWEKMSVKIDFKFIRFFIRAQTHGPLNLSFFFCHFIKCLDRFYTDIIRFY